MGPAFDHLVLRPGELALKQKNREELERTVLANLKRRMRHHPGTVCRRTWGRFYVGPIEHAERLARDAQRVFGIVNVSPARRVEPAPDAIATGAQALVEDALAAQPGDDRVRFRVSVKRADKAFPTPTNDLQRELGGALVAAWPRLVVDLGHAELDLGVEIRPEGAFLFLEKLPAAGGMPAGSEGRVLALLSGGIDSPVAAWLAMKRGCRVDFVHFQSQPFTGPASIEKVRDLARVLGDWQNGFQLFLVPFADCQVAIHNLSSTGYRVVLYRRLMLRIAERIAAAGESLALVTGDNLGQVASQTLCNIHTIDAVRTTLPVLRPLIGWDKQETIALARRIGTYEISVRPFPDSCTIFAPSRPVTRGEAVVAAALEAELDLETLVGDAVARTRLEKP